MCTGCAACRAGLIGACGVLGTGTLLGGLGSAASRCACELRCVGSPCKTLHIARGSLAKARCRPGCGWIRGDALVAADLSCASLRRSALALVQATSGTTAARLQSQGLHTTYARRTGRTHRAHVDWHSKCTSLALLSAPLDLPRREYKLAPQGYICLHVVILPLCSKAYSTLSLTRNAALACDVQGLPRASTSVRSRTSLTSVSYNHLLAGGYNSARSRHSCGRLARQSFEPHRTRCRAEQERSGRLAELHTSPVLCADMTQAEDARSPRCRVDPVAPGGPMGCCSLSDWALARVLLDMFHTRRSRSTAKLRITG